MNYSTTPEWVKITVSVLLIAAGMFAAYHFGSKQQSLDTSTQDSVIEKSDVKTKKLDKQADRIKEELQDLTVPEREEQHFKIITKSNTDAKSKIDSVALLDFNQQSIYWTDEIARLDSVRSTY